MEKRNQYSSTFKYKIVDEVHSYQSVHKVTLKVAINKIAIKYNISIYTLKNWVYSTKEDNQTKKKNLNIAAMAISTPINNFNVKTFFNSLSPFKRMLACIIGLHKHLK